MNLGDDDITGDKADRLRDVVAVFGKEFQVERQRFAEVPLGLLAAFPRGDTAGDIGAEGRPVMLAGFVDD